MGCSLLLYRFTTGAGLSPPAVGGSPFHRTPPVAKVSPKPGGSWRFHRGMVRLWRGRDWARSGLARMGRGGTGLSGPGCVQCPSGLIWARTRSRAAKSTGLTRWPSQPAARDWSRSLSWPHPVRATIVGGGAPRLLADAAGRFEAVEDWETDVHQDERGAEGLGRFDGFGPVVGQCDLVAQDAEEGGHAVGAVAVVVNDQDPSAGGWRGLVGGGRRGAGRARVRRRAAGR
jgi:hypothetical protein